MPVKSIKSKWQVSCTGFLIVLFSMSAEAQEKKRWLSRLVYKLVIDTTSSESRSFRVYPTIAYSPETSFEFGFSSLMLFRAKQDTLNRLSEINAFTFVTLRQQYGLWFDNAIYGDQDKWFFLGRTRIQRFPLLYYGIGPVTPGNAPAIVDANYILFRQRVLRKIVPNLFFGPEVDYQLLSKTEFKQPENHAPYPLPAGSSGTGNLGGGLALVYDNRHNVLNVRKGFFGEIAFLNYNKTFGSDFSFHSWNVDFRSFHPIRKNNVIAWQVTGNFINGQVPFNQMAQMGGDMMMRGYYQGRYRDKNLVAAQVEYRMLPFSFSRRIGGTVFASLANVSPALDQMMINKTRLAGGAGLRYLLFPKKDIFLRFDLGFTEEGPGFYIFTGEAF